MHAITSKLSAELDARLTAAAHARRETKSVTIRKILQAQLSDFAVYRKHGRRALGLVAPGR